MGKRQDLVGKKFGRLTVIEFSHLGKLLNSYWKVRCDCGEEKIVRGTNFTTGSTKSCGCFHLENAKMSASKRNNLTRLPTGVAVSNAIYKRYLKNAEKRNKEFLISKEQFLKISQQDCHYCGCPPSTTETMGGANGSFTYNGIDRKNNDIGYRIENCLPCCSDCNWLKGSADYDMFLDRVSKIAAHRSKNET